MPFRTLAGCLLAAMSVVHSSAQPLPTGERIKTLANRAGILIGVRTLSLGADYDAIVEREFNVGTRTWYPRWNSAYTGIGMAEFSDFDAGVNWLHARGMKPMHHLLFGPDMYEQPWVIALTSAAQLEAVLQDRIRSIMESNDNKNKVNVWNVSNENFQWSSSSGAYFPETGTGDALVWLKMGWEDDLSGLTGEDRVNARHPVFLRKAYEYASQLAAGKLELRDNSIEAPCRKARAFYQLARHLKNAGVGLDAVGMQCHFNLESPGMIDSAGLVAEIQKYRALGLEVYFTEVDIGSASGTWNDQLAQIQRREYRKLITIALKTGVSQVHFWGLRDDDEGWRRGQHPLLFNPDNTPKPAYYGVQEALEAYLASVPAGSVPGSGRGGATGERSGAADEVLANGRKPTEVPGAKLQRAQAGRQALFGESK